MTSQRKRRKISNESPKFLHLHPTRFPRRQEYAKDLQLHLVESTYKQK